MFNISNNEIITINRGDSFTLSVFVNIGTVLDPLQYLLQDDDKLFLGIMEPNQPFEHALIRKAATSADEDSNYNIDFVFKPEDTECLLPGLYYYQVKLVRNYSTDNPTVDTIITKKKFIVLD